MTARQSRLLPDDGGNEAESSGPFRVILADPPWAYAQRTVRLNGTTGHHYAAMSLDAIAALPVASVVADDAVLLLWTTWPFLAEAMQVIEAWGFAYVTGLPWVKVDRVAVDGDGEVRFRPRYGVGFWARGASEPLLMARRGKASPKTDFVALLANNAQHSRKPDEVHDLAEQFGSPRLELFARRRRPGWTSAGDAVDDGVDIRTRLGELRDRRIGF